MILDRYMFVIKSGICLHVQIMTHTILYLSSVLKYMKQVLVLYLSTALKWEGIIVLAQISDVLTCV